MNLTLETGVSAVTVFLQGLLSFFSPCVLPLIPLYIGYLSGGAKSADEEGNLCYKRSRVMINTLFFILGISFAFFLLGLGFTAAGRFFNSYQTLFTRIGGLIVILFGLYQLGIFGDGSLKKERRIRFHPDSLAMNPLTALALGFTFSFAWTPCVGPALASVLILAASASSSLTGFVLIGVYTLGFVLPFMAVGLFTGTLLDLFKRHRSVVKYTVKIGGILMLLMGIMMFTGWMNHISSYLSQAVSMAERQSGAAADQPAEEDSSPQDASAEADIPGTEADPAAAHTHTEEKAAGDNNAVPAPDFSLSDQFGSTHTLSSYKGKTIFLNFWATWCPPCRAEMPEIQEIYEDYGSNQGDVIILGVASPDYGQEGSQEDIAAFMEENSYTYPVAMDVGGLISYEYGVSAYPTTFMIDADGNVFGYVSGQITKEIMESIIEQTKAGVRSQ
ncbi:MAG: cytochrome c biogenesis protein CcdA [Kineothrix sp.]